MKKLMSALVVVMTMVACGPAPVNQPTTSQKVVVRPDGTYKVSSYVCSDAAKKDALNDMAGPNGKLSIAVSGGAVSLIMTSFFNQTETYYFGGTFTDTAYTGNSSKAPTCVDNANGGAACGATYGNRFNTLNVSYSISGNTLTVTRAADDAFCAGVASTMTASK